MLEVQQFLSCSQNNRYPLLIFFPPRPCGHLNLFLELALQVSWKISTTRQLSALSFARHNLYFVVKKLYTGLAIYLEFRPMFFVFHLMTSLMIGAKHLLFLNCSLSGSAFCSFPALSCEFASVDVSDVLGTVRFYLFLPSSICFLLASNAAVYKMHLFLLYK